MYFVTLRVASNSSLQRQIQAKKLRNPHQKLLSRARKVASMCVHNFSVFFCSPLGTFIAPECECVCVFVLRLIYGQTCGNFGKWLANGNDDNGDDAVNRLIKHLTALQVRSFTKKKTDLTYQTLTYDTFSSSKILF